MPVQTNGADSTKGLKGLHLYHTDVSNCCDRVRITLAEKELPWNSRFFVLPRGDHLSEEFFSINPRGVVPVLVDDGVIVTESSDIISYIDERFPKPALRPKGEQQQRRMRQWMSDADAIHPAIAALSFEFLFKAAPYSAEFFQRRARLRQEPDPAIDQIFNYETGEVSAQAVRQAIISANVAFAELDSALQRSPYLLGTEFSLADLSWAVQIHRLKSLRLRDIDSHTYLTDWYRRLEQRPCIKSGMLDWETPEVYALFNDYLDQREAAGTDVCARIWRD